MLEKDKVMFQKINCQVGKKYAKKCEDNNYKLIMNKKKLCHFDEQENEILLLFSAAFLGG